MVPAAEMVQKVRAAVDARVDENLQIVARTDAYATDGLQAAIDRAGRYLEAGADIIFVEAPKLHEEITRITRSIPAPQIVNMVIGGKTPPMSYQDMSDAGVAIVLYANASLQGAILGMQNALGRLWDAKVIAESDGIVATFAERQRLVGKDGVDALEKDILAARRKPHDNAPGRAVISAKKNCSPTRRPASGAPRVSAARPGC